jgi:hypothetical protein
MRQTVVALIVLFAACAGHSRVTPRLPVPPTLTSEDQVEVLARLSRLVELSRTKQWNEVYEYLGPCVDKPTPWPTLAEFLKTPRKYVSRINKFRPDGIDSLPTEDALIIYGCGEYGSLFLSEKFDTMVFACRSGATWRFSDFSLVHVIDSPPTPCKR